MKTTETRRRRGSSGTNLRTFDAEITFSGLSVMRIIHHEGWNEHESRGPRKVGKLELLFPNTEHDDDNDVVHHCRHAEYQDHRHYPRLTYYAADHLGLKVPSRNSPRKFGYLPSPEGREVVALDIPGKEVEIILPYQNEEDRPSFSELFWCSPRKSDGRLPDQPVGRKNEYCLDWVLRADQINLGDIDASKALAKIKVPHGRWRTRGVYRNREVATLEPIRWQLVGKTSQKPIELEAMSRDLVLELKELVYGLTIRISDLESPGLDPYDIVLTPGWNENLRFSLTNLPDVPQHADGSHVGMYANLSTKAGSVLTPVQTDDVVCGRTYCEQAVHFK